MTDLAIVSQGAKSITAQIRRKPMEVISDFLRGQSDCRNGNPHLSGQSHDYDRGYSTQYQIEQIASEQTR